MFILATWEPEVKALQGIGVACATGGIWYVVPYEIDEALDANQWIIDNEATILAEAPTKGVILDVATTVRELLDEERGVDAQQMIDDMDDIADLHKFFGLRKLLKALVLVVLDEINAIRTEINVLRQWAGFSPIALRTAEQLKTALRNKLKEIA